MWRKCRIKKCGRGKRKPSDALESSVCRRNGQCPSSSANLEAFVSSFGSEPQDILDGCLAWVKRRYVDKFGGTQEYFSDLSNHLHQKTSAVSVLPFDLIHHIVEFLLDDPRTLGRMAQVCKQWNTMLSRSCVWQKVCHQKLGCIPDPMGIQAPHQVYTDKLFCLIGQQDYEPSLLDIVPLIKAGADLNTPTGPRKVTPLILAAYHGHINVVEWLIHFGSCRNQRSGCGKSALMLACWGNRRKLVARLAQLGCRLDDRDACGDTSLMCAARGGATCVIAWLLTQNIDVTARNNDGATALHCAALCGQTECLSLLTGSTQSSLSWKNVYGETAFLSACRRAHTNSMKALLEMGSDISATTSDGCNAIMLLSLGESHPHVADPTQHANIIERLVAHSGDRLSIHAVDRFGNTALHIAKQNFNSNIENALLRLGADSQTVNNFGATPEDHAAIVRALRNKEGPRLRHLLNRVTGLVLTMSATSRTNLSNPEFKELVSALKDNRTVRCVRLMYTNIDLKPESSTLLSLFETNFTICDLYFGEREQHQLPDFVHQRLDRNRLISMPCKPGVGNDRCDAMQTED